MPGKNLRNCGFSACVCRETNNALAPDVTIATGTGACRACCVKVEALYREIRAMRIYEGATEVQKLIIARELLKTHANTRRQAAE